MDDGCIMHHDQISGTGKMFTGPRTCKAILFASFFCVSLVFGCSATITAFFDEDTSAGFVRMQGNRLAGGITNVELNAQRFEKNDLPSYSLILVYSGPMFLNIGMGSTLILHIDDTPFELSGSGSQLYRTVVSIGLVEEKAFYHDIDPTLFQLLAHAREVTIEIHGEKTVLERHFNYRNFQGFQKFYDLYVRENLAVD